MRGMAFFRKKLAARQQSIQAIVETADGKVLYTFIRKLCRADDTSFNSDPCTMAFYEGRRSIWLEIQAELGKEPTELIRQAELLDRQQEAVMGYGDGIERYETQ